MFKGPYRFMIRFIISLSLLVYSYCVFALDYKKIQKFQSDSLLIIKKTNQTKKKKIIYLFKGKKLVGKGIIKQCKKRSCLVRYKSKVWDLQASEVRYLFKSEYKSKSKSSSKSQSSSELPGLYLGVAGPLSNSIVLQYEKKYTNFSYSLGIGQMMLPISNVQVTGTNFEFGLGYNFYQNSSSCLSIRYLLGYSSAKLDFTQVDDFGEVAEENFTSHTLNLSYELNLFSSFYLKVLFGQSFNSLKEEYANQYDTLYTLPIGMQTLTYGAFLGMSF